MSAPLDRNPEVVRDWESSSRSLAPGASFAVSVYLIEDTFPSRRAASDWFAALGCALSPVESQGCLKVVKGNAPLSSAPPDAAVVVAPWDASRKKELKQLLDLLVRASELNSSSGALDHLAKINKLARQLTSADIDTGRDSFARFLVRASSGRV